MIKYYNLHNKIHMRVVNPSKIFDRLQMFECEPLHTLDLDVIIGSFKVDKDKLEKTGSAYRNYNTFYVEHRHKVSFWSILIEDLSESKTTILFDGDPFFSTELLLMLILEPLFVYKMSKKGGLVLHSSALSINDVGCLFTGDTGIGKTSILLKMLNGEDTKYYADDQTFIVDEKIYSYPVPIGFRKHLVDRNNVVVSAKNSLILSLHSLINHALGFYSNLTQRINVDEIQFDSGIFVVPGDVTSLKKVFILKKTGGSPNIHRISGVDAYPLMLNANNKNEDKLELFYKFVSLYSDGMAETFWSCFEHNLHELTDSENIEFWLVELNRSYDYDEILDEIRQVVSSD